MDLFLKIFHCYSKHLPQPIPYLFWTFSNKETQSNDPPYSAPFPTKKIQSNNLTPIPTKRTQSNNQLFPTYSKKETHGNSPTYSAPFPTKKTQSNNLGWKLGLRLLPYALHVSFPLPVLPPSLPCTEATPMPAQEPILSTPSPALLNTFTEQFFDRSKHRACTPAVSRSLICHFPS